MDLKGICNNTVELTQQVGGYIREQRTLFNSDKVKVKGKNDFVSHVDKSSEEQLVAGLKKILPGSGFIAEEGTSGREDGQDYVWIIDPLDGTTNFIHGAPPYAISVALMYKTELILGIVYEVTFNEAFYAYDGGKAFLNGEEIKVSTTPTVANSLIATGFPYNEYGRLQSFMKTLDFFFHNSHGVRRLGSAATDLAYVACGRYDSFYEYNLKPWDVAGGAYLVQMAGGKCTRFDGSADFVFGKEVIASNTVTHDELVKSIGGIMNP